MGVSNRNVRPRMTPAWLFATTIVIALVMLGHYELYTRYWSPTARDPPVERPRASPTPMTSGHAEIESRVRALEQREQERAATERQRSHVDPRQSDRVTPG